MSKVAEVIKELQQRFKPEDDIVIQYWTKEDIESVVLDNDAVFLKDDNLTAQQFSDLAEDIEHYSNWDIVSEYFGDIYENWKA